MAGYSILILTSNEERNLPRCLRSVAGADDIVVLDSGSTDRTTDLARDAGARVFHRPFDHFAGQRNYAQRGIPFRHPWVFHLDADEQFTPELHAACGAIGTDDPNDGYFVAPKMLWNDRWVPHCTDYPAWQARFVRAPRFEFIEVGHGQREASQMRMGRLTANYLHDLSAGGKQEWLAKHRRYAHAEARQFLRDQGAVRLGDIFSRPPLRRRRALKHFSYMLPFRGAARFVYQYFWRRGFLDGASGLQYCWLLSRYEKFAANELRRLKAEAR